MVGIPERETYSEDPEHDGVARILGLGRATLDRMDAGAAYLARVEYVSNTAQTLTRYILEDFDTPPLVTVDTARAYRPVITRSAEVVSLGNQEVIASPPETVHIRGRLASFAVFRSVSGEPELRAFVARHATPVATPAGPHVPRWSVPLEGADIRSVAVQENRLERSLGHVLNTRQHNAYAEDMVMGRFHDIAMIARGEEPLSTRIQKVGQLFDLELRQPYVTEATQELLLDLISLHLKPDVPQTVSVSRSQRLISTSLPLSFVNGGAGHFEGVQPAFDVIGETGRRRLACIFMANGNWIRVASSHVIGMKDTQ